MQANFFRQNIRFREDCNAWDEKGCHLGAILILILIFDQILADLNSGFLNIPENTTIFHWQPLYLYFKPENFWLRK
jgi:hypothetical protein